MKKDEGNRPQTDLEGLSSLPPVYGEGKFITAGNASQLSEDVVTFLKWAAEPELEVRKNLGIKVILFFLVLGTIVYLAKNRLWREVH